MTKHVKLSKAVYAGCDHLRIEPAYSKDAGGYVINCTPVRREPFGFSMVFDATYFALAPRMGVLVCPAVRRSAKKEQEAEQMLQDAGRLAREFLDRIGRQDILVEGEV